MRKTSPCSKQCPMRNAYCHGKYPNGKWRCKTWGDWQEEKAAEPKKPNDPLNGYAADKRRKLQHKKHMERRL